jgi:hypothetical protein
MVEAEIIRIIVSSPAPKRVVDPTLKLRLHLLELPLALHCDLDLRLVKLRLAGFALHQHCVLELILALHCDLDLRLALHCVLKLRLAGFALHRHCVLELLLALHRVLGWCLRGSGSRSAEERLTMSFIVDALNFFSLRLFVLTAAGKTGL